MKTKINSHLIVSVFLFGTLITLSTCRKDVFTPENKPENKQVEKLITAASGGVLITSDSVKLTIPPYALPMDGKVFVGRTGNEPTSVPNKNLKIEGEPITMRLPSDSILKTIQLSFPRSSGSIDPNNYFIVLFNGSTYFPMEYSLTGTKVIVSIDKINWETINKKGAGLFTEYIVMPIINKQVPPASEMGLNKVSIRSGTMYFERPTANSSSKVLLLVHGLTGDASGWNVFLPKIISETNPKYSEFWTFVYNSSWSIKDNAKLLAIKLKTYANGAQIDIVAHSMGGLVSRSMIEQFDGAQYVNKLITLGTPHKGSPLTVFRYLLGGLVLADDPLFNSSRLITYNFLSQGVKDLGTTSEFIGEMNELNNPLIPYFTIASTNDFFAIPRNGLEVAARIFGTSMRLPGLDDGVVSVSSAKGVQGAASPSLDINIPVILAHLDMTGNDPIYKQVLDFLRLSTSSGTVTDIDGNVYKTVKIGNQWWMAENLKTMKYRDGTSIPNVTDNTAWGNLTTGAYCWYNNDVATYRNTYGALYNWYTVNTGKLCPMGWHVPTDAEWTTLTTYLGGESVAGGKLKEAGTAHWTSPNTGATNESGFTALPGGGRNDKGAFYNVGYFGNWWSAKENFEENFDTWWWLSYCFNSINEYWWGYSFPQRRSCGFSVRCIKD